MARSNTIVGCKITEDEGLKPRNRLLKFVVSDVCVVETTTTAVLEKEAPPQPEPEVENIEKSVVEDEKEATVVEDEKVAKSASFKEESNKVDNLDSGGTQQA
ncbi:Uncharacterized protein Fot_14194 [Forsythia ovata]|uniref:Uncharacterized protein n=1 Tax=Forsythia ovata TaxID=205694 RepID=A0ABD1W5P0_9LAMI